MLITVALGGFAMAQSQESPPQTPQIQSDQKPDSAAKRQTQSDNHVNPAAQQPAIEQQHSPSDAKREADKDAEKRAEEAREYWPFHVFGARLKITDSLLALFTFLLIVVGAVQGAFLYRTDQGTHKAADAAQKSSKVAEDSLFKLQRASIFMPDMNTNWHRDTERDGKFWWHFRPVFHNSGNTQPLDMLTNVVFVLRDTPLPEGYDFPPDANNQPAVVIPHGAIYGRSQNLTDDQLIEVQKGTKFYYIYGTVTYRDVFDGTPVHTTKFCRQVINILGDLTRPHKEVTEMFFAIVFPEHNTAD